MSGERQRPYRKLLVFPLPELFGLGLLLFTAASPGLMGDLLSWDDVRYVTENEAVRSFKHVPYVFTHFMFEAYHPLHIVSYMVDYALWGLWAPGYHVHNAVLFLIGLIFLNKLLFELVGSRKWSFLLTALFALHPLHVETVVWITARKEILAFLFFMIAAAAYPRMETWKSGRGFIVVFFLLLSLLSKSHSVVFPIFLLGVDLFLKRKGWRRSILRMLPLLVLSVGFSVLVYSLWQENELARPRPPSFAAHAALVAESYIFYLKALFIPFPTSPVYPILRDPAWHAATIAGILLFGVITWFVRKVKNGWARLGWYWFAFSLLPVSNIVPVYFFVADRYAFWAVLSLVFLCAYLKDAAVRAGRDTYMKALAAFLAAAVVVFGVLFWNYSGKWRDDLTLWTHAARARPSSYYAHMKLGEVLRDRGDFDEAGRQYRKAIALRPELKFAQAALCFSEAKRFALENNRREKEWQRLVAQLLGAWNDAGTLEQLKELMLRSGYLACGEIAEDRSFALVRPDEKKLLIAASVWVRAGSPERALAHLQKVSPKRLNEKLSYHLTLAAAYTDLDKKEKAMEEIERAEELNSQLHRQDVDMFIKSLELKLKE